MKKLLLALLTTLSLSAFAQTQEICSLEIYKTEVFGEIDGKVMKGKRINSDQIPLKMTSFPQDIIILRDADDDVLGFYEEYSPERNGYAELRTRKDIKAKNLSIRVLKRFIYSKVYLNIQSGDLSLDIPVVADQKTRLSIPMGKDVFLRCEN